MLQTLWVTVRVFINPPRDFIELSLISYMLYYQDNRNQTAIVTQNSSNTSINSSDNDSSKFFSKIGFVDPQNDSSNK